MAKKGKGNQIGVYVIVGLICFAMIGFGATNFGGTVNSIGNVGDREISVTRYASALRNRLGQLSQQFGTDINFAQAQVLGIDQQVLSQVTASVALEAEAAEIGLSAGDTALRDELVQIRGFHGIDGSFDREAYRFYLERNGQTEREFEEDLRAEIARSLLQQAVVGGVGSSETFTETLMGYVGERRNFTWARMTEADLAEPLAEPTEADLRGYFDANPDAFMLPETRRITYAWVSPEMMTDQVTPEEDVLRALYDERADEYNIPARRLVERLVLGDEAEAAKARLDAGEITFEALVAERGLELSDIDMGDVTEADLGDAGAGVFAADLGIAGPFDSNLGPALFRVNAILAPQSTSFEDARADLAQELALEEAELLIADQIELVDDLLAGGATLEELAAETDLQLGEIAFSAESSGGIADFASFREAAQAAEPGDFPEATELDNGGLFAMRLEEVIAPRLAEFADVETQAREGWRQQALETALTAQAEGVLADLAGSGLAISEEVDITRTEFISGTAPSFVQEVFALEAGGTTVIPANGDVLLVQLTEILPPDAEDPQMTQIQEQLSGELQRSIGSDILSAFATAVQNEQGISIDQMALQAVHVNFQ